VQALSKQQLLAILGNQKVNDSNDFICGVAERAFQQIRAQSRDRKASWMSAAFHVARSGMGH
jgi:hypothetical protein